MLIVTQHIHFLTTKLIRTTIHHSYVLGDHLNLVNTVLFIQNGFVLVLSSKYDSI